MSGQHWKDRLIIGRELTGCQETCWLFSGRANVHTLLDALVEVMNGMEELSNSASIDTEPPHSPVPSTYLDVWACSKITTAGNGK